MGNIIREVKTCDCCSSEDTKSYCTRYFLEFSRTTPILFNDLCSNCSEGIESNLRNIIESNGYRRIIIDYNNLEWVFEP